MIVVSYNHFAFLPQLLESIEGQGVRPGLTILCDDASTDGSARVLTDFAERTTLRTVVRLNDRNRGLTPTLNAALALVDTPYFTYISGDDYMLPGHLATQLALLAGDPDLAFVYSDAIRVDETGAELGHRFFDNHGRSKEDVDDFRSLLHRNWIPAASVVASTAAVRAVGDTTRHSSSRTTTCGSGSRRRGPSRVCASRPWPSVRWPAPWGTPASATTTSGGSGPRYASVASTSVVTTTPIAPWPG